jgi:hypothetical protein
MHGQAVLASTSIGQDLAETDRVKVVCLPTTSVDASIRTLLSD